jgi:hypothetical protein
LKKSEEDCQFLLEKSQKSSMEKKIEDIQKNLKSIEDISFKRIQKNKTNKILYRQQI